MTMLSINDDVVIESCDGGGGAADDDDDDDGVADSSGDMSATRRIAASIMLMFVRRCDVGRSGFEVKDATAAVVDVDDALVAVVGVALVVTVVAGDVADEEAKSARARSTSSRRSTI